MIKTPKFVFALFLFNYQIFNLIAQENTDQNIVGAQADSSSDYFISNSLNKDNMLFRSDSILSDTVIIENPMSDNDLRQRVLEIVIELGELIGLIGEKNEGSERAVADRKRRAMDQALRHFIDDKQIVQISSLKYPTHLETTEIKKYFNRLRRLDYDKVEITWVEVGSFSKFYKGLDGRYYGSTEIIQKFRATKDGKVVYQDKTTKKIEIVLIPKEIERIKNIQDYDVRLAKIWVVETEEF